MKNLLLTIFLVACLVSKAQDTICFTNGKKMVAKVMSISPTNVSYRDIGLTASKTKLLLKKDVRYIIYSSNTFDIVSLKGIRPAEMDSMFRKGQEDAEKYYTNPGGSIGTGIASFATGGILGLVPAVFCSAQKPKTPNLGLPKNASINNKSYMFGYVSRAKKMKEGRVWTGYFVGLAGAIAFLLVSK